MRAFVLRSKHLGIRAVSLAWLAKETQMSLATIYRHFPSKEHLVAAAVESWAVEYSASHAVRDGLGSFASAEQGLIAWASAKAKGLSQFSPIFWEDLRGFYPEIWRQFQVTARGIQRRGRDLLAPHTRHDLNQDLVFELFQIIFQHVQDQETAQRCGITQSEAIATAAKLWASGALQTPRKRTKQAVRAH